MNIPSGARPHSFLRLIPQVASLGAVGIGCMVLIGWVFDIPTLKSILPTFVHMKVNTAIGFVLAGISLWLKQTGHPGGRAGYVAQGCAVVVVVIGVLSFLENLLGWDFGIDELFFEDRWPGMGNAVPGRMALVSGFAFAVTGVALLLLDYQTRRGLWPAQLLAVVVVLITLVDLTGYWYGVSAFYNTLRFLQMAVHTIVAFLALGLGLLFARPDRGLMTVVTAKSAGGAMARRLLPAAILIPLVLGWVRVKGQEAGLYDPDLGIALVVVLCVLIFSPLIWWNAHFLHRADTERQRVEADRQRLDEELKRRAQEQAVGAREQAAAVTQTMTTVEEITQTAEQSAQRARRVGEAVTRNLDIGKAGRKAVTDALAAMVRVREQVEETVESILALAERAQDIGEIIATVDDIAEQTHLLALNAAIEAGRAGEQGKGFAVVAGEVRALADQSKKATAKVRRILGEIQKATRVAVDSTEEVTKGVGGAITLGGQSGETIGTLAEALAEAAKAAGQIVASAGQQAQGMVQINQAMRNIEEVARQNLEVSQKTERAAQHLTELGTQLAGPGEEKNKGGGP